MTTTNNKTLYFEGAGWEEADSSKATIGNCRARTAFTNNDGKQIYLEISTGYIQNKKSIERYFMHIDHLFYIVDGEGDENVNGIRFDRQDLRDNYNYSVEDITKWINKNLNCSFKDILALPNLAGYRVHADNKGYNLADNFIYDKELLEKRIEVKKHFDKSEKLEGKKYPNFSLWVDSNNNNILHLLRHFNGYNKHWEINTDIENWIDTVKETKLGKYGC